MEKKDKGGINVERWRTNGGRGRGKDGRKGDRQRELIDEERKRKKAGCRGKGEKE